MKNTKLTFYCTHFQYGRFEKIVFEIVIDEAIDSLADAKKWLNEDTIIAIYRQYDLDLVFDWIIIRYAKTSENVKNLHEIKRIDGQLIFPEKRTRKPKSESEPTSNYFLTPDQYKKKLDRLAKAKALESGQPVPSPKKEYRSCWIDTSGKTHWVGFALHNEYASNWLEKHDNAVYKKILTAFSRYHYEELEDRGWIKILGWTDPPSFVLPDNITPKQKQTLREYCISQKVAYESWPEILKR